MTNWKMDNWVEDGIDEETNQEEFHYGDDNENNLPEITSLIGKTYKVRRIYLYDNRLLWMEAYRQDAWGTKFNVALSPCEILFVPERGLSTDPVLSALINFSKGR